MSVYSTRFVLTNTLSAWATLFTAPSGYTVVIRDISFTNGATATTTFSLAIQASGGNSAIVTQLENMAAGASSQWTGRQVMNAGDTLLAQSTAAGGHLCVSGYQLQ